MIVLVFAGITACAGFAPAEENRIGYRHDILPILSDRCFKCHGPDSASRQAGLRLDLPDAATAELDSGVKAIVPGKPAESALVERIMSKDPDEMMPPPNSGKILSDAERALLRRWIEQGAKYEKHWAFVAPVRPRVPEVKHRDLVRNPIDGFVLARLDAEGIEPAPRASKERLIRRLYFDLIGLPPSLPEIDAFLADDVARRLRKIVDRLLHSPHYGERMATDWLDGARFADSNGYQNDFSRNMSPWRDWVIDAFNKHMHYDQFVDRADRGRPVAESHPRTANRDRLQSQSPNGNGGRIDRGRMVRRKRRRPSRNDGHGHVGFDRGLRTVPRSQVRSDHAKGILSIVCFLREYKREGRVHGDSRKRTTGRKGRDCRERKENSPNSTQELPLSTSN